MLPSLFTRVIETILMKCRPVIPVFGMMTVLTERVIVRVVANGEVVEGKEGANVDEYLRPFAFKAAVKPATLLLPR